MQKCSAARQLRSISCILRLFLDAFVHGVDPVGVFAPHLRECREILIGERNIRERRHAVDIRYAVLALLEHTAHRIALGVVAAVIRIDDRIGRCDLVHLCAEHEILAAEAVISVVVMQTRLIDHVRKIRVARRGVDDRVGLDLLCRSVDVLHLIVEKLDAVFAGVGLELASDRIHECVVDLDAVAVVASLIGGEYAVERLVENLEECGA